MKKDFVQEKQAEGGELKGEFVGDLQRDSTFDEDKKVNIKNKPENKPKT